MVNVMEKEFALTTSDNPFNPIKDFDRWFFFDQIEKGYCTCQYLDSISMRGDGLGDVLNDEIIEAAIDEAVQLDLIALRTENKVHYVKVTG